MIPFINIYRYNELSKKKKKGIKWDISQNFVLLPCKRKHLN